MSIYTVRLHFSALSWTVRISPHLLSADVCSVQKKFLPDHSHGKQCQLYCLKILCLLTRSEVYHTMTYSTILYCTITLSWGRSRCCPHLLSASVHIFADSPHLSTLCLHVSTLCPQVKKIFLVGKVIARYYVN